MTRSNAVLVFVAVVSVLSFFVGCARSPRESEEPGGTSDPITEYRRGLVFDGERFLERSICVAEEVVVACDGPVAEAVDLAGGFVVPPLGDAHTHHFDSPYTLAWQRSASLNAGVFYAMTMTAPTRQVVQIRDRLSGPKNVDVATSLGGITGPESHPAEVYEALALGIRSYEQQVARAEEIQASRKAVDDAYFVVAAPEDVDAKLGRLLSEEPDFIKVYLRKSERFDEGYGKWGPGGGIDPQLLPRIRQRTREAGLRLAVANSSIADFRESLRAEADLVSHLPCYQDTMSDPDSPYYDVDTAEECLVSERGAERAATIGMISVLIVSQWAVDRPEPYDDWEKHNIAVLEAAGAPLAIGSNAYGSTVVDGLVAGAERGVFEPVRLLRLATVDTPRAIFPDRNVGCLATGCEASFLVLDGNPLEDFASIRSIRLRVKDGEVLTSEEIEASEER